MQLKRAKQDEIQAIEGRNTVVKPTLQNPIPEPKEILHMTMRGGV